GRRHVPAAIHAPHAIIRTANGRRREIQILSEARISAMNNGSLAYMVVNSMSSGHIAVSQAASAATVEPNAWRAILQVNATVAVPSNAWKAGTTQACTPNILYRSA